MNIFSNIGITELIVILLLALLVVGPERLPEMGRMLAKTLRDVRRAYENLTRDLGPELMSLQETTREIRESVESVRSIPKDMVDSVVKAADLGDTMTDLKGVTSDLQKVSKDVAQVTQTVQHPMRAVTDSARQIFAPPAPETAGNGPAENRIFDAAPAVEEGRVEGPPTEVSQDLPQEQSND